MKPEPAGGSLRPVGGVELCRAAAADEGMRRCVGGVPDGARWCDDWSILAFANHMANTARTDEARELYQAFIRLERERYAAEQAQGVDLFGSFS